MVETEEKAVARLRESKARATQALFKAGEVAGVEYVLDEDTEFAELDQLERWIDALGRNQSSAKMGITFHEVAYHMNAGTGDIIEECVRDANGDNIDNPTWVEGFISGALSKFQALKPKLG